MRKTKLKPCPFCGSKAKMYYDYHDFALVQCTECAVGTLHKPDEDEVIKDWNTRKPMDSYVEQLKWERDVAISQLEELGIGFGKKVDGKVVVAKMETTTQRKEVTK